MKYFPGGSYLVMRINPRFPGGIPPRAIGYKYNSRKFLGFIATKGAGSTESGDPYLYCFPEMYYNVYICPIDCTNLIGRYFNACNSIDNKNRMQQSDTELDKYWVTQSGYFRLSTTVALCMGIADGSSYSVMAFQRKIWTRKFQP